MISYIIQSKQTGILHVITANGEISKVVNNDCHGSKWSPDGKWLSYLTYEEFKVRPEGTLSEADFEEVRKITAISFFISDPAKTLLIIISREGYSFLIVVSPIFYSKSVQFASSCFSMK